MIHPAAGVAFTLADDGDIRADSDARNRVARRLGIAEDWATVRQVHGAVTVEVDEAGDHGEADALFTTRPGVPLAVFTADCLAVALVGPGGVGVAHAGWRGLAAGVVDAVHQAMRRAGCPPERAHVGPGIGPCCYEVGDEVARRFEGMESETTWGTGSIDLVGAARLQLGGMPVWVADRCTLHQPGHHSHRGTGTTSRMAGLAWHLAESGREP